MNLGNMGLTMGIYLDLSDLCYKMGECATKSPFQLQTGLTSSIVIIFIKMELTNPFCNQNPCNRPYLALIKLKMAQYRLLRPLFSHF